MSNDFCSYLMLGEPCVHPVSCLPEETHCNDNCCGCDYQYAEFEHVLKYAKNIPNLSENEIKLKKASITELLKAASKEFDKAVHGKPNGYYRMANGCLKYKKFNVTNQSHIKIPPAIRESIRVFYNGREITNSVKLTDYGLVFNPCAVHYSCGCDNSCGIQKSNYNRNFPNGCYQILAKWGLECIPYDIKTAVISYVLYQESVFDGTLRFDNQFGNRINLLPNKWENTIKSERMILRKNNLIGI